LREQVHWAGPRFGSGLFLTSDNARARDLQPLAVLAIHAAVFVALLWWSWRKWPDPLIDFGRELYLPWRINEGQVLYRDIASLFGPLSPYVNALWFRLFGPSLLTLAIANAVIFAATVFGIYHLVRLSTDRLTATAAGLVSLLLFGFSQYMDVGNYNFITPYSHETTHGMALSVACLVLLHEAFARRSRRLSGAAGLCFGLTLLTKPEIAIALGAGVIAGSLAMYAVRGDDRGGAGRSVVIFLGMAAVPLIVFFSYFSIHMDSGSALRATGGAWVPLFGTGITNNVFYRRSMGLDAPVQNAGRMLVTFIAFLALVGAALAVSWGKSAGASSYRGSRWLRIGFLAAVIFALRQGTFPRALPLIAITAMVVLITIVMRARDDRDQARSWIVLLSWAAFAVVLLAKMGLNPRISHYGFYLALPATVVAVVVMLWLIPHVLAGWRSQLIARRFQQLALWMLVAAIAPYLVSAHRWYRTRALAVGSGSDRFYASTMGEQGRLVREALAMLDEVRFPGATLAVMPEGVMLNYLMQLESPLRVINLMPPEIMAFGEDDVVRSLEARPPDFVVLINKNMSEYGYPQFGHDARYGLRTRRWIDERFESVSLVSKGGRADSDPVIRLLRRKTD
jgi:4-amino-4-deoxy-L-arabinose transferase-like glycosyltransferase